MPTINEYIQLERDDKRRLKGTTIRSLDSSCYRPTEHVFPTSNIVERLFSRAKLVISDLRSSMTPQHLEIAIYLRYHHNLWNVETVEKSEEKPQWNHR